MDLFLFGVFVTVSIIAVCWAFGSLPHDKRYGD